MESRDNRGNSNRDFTADRFDSAVRADFPILSEPENGKRIAYLDNAATTQKPRAVLDAITHYYWHDNANPHRGVYELGVRATQAHESARQTAADFIHAEPDEIIFTQNTTEGLNLVAYSYARQLLKPGDEIALSVAEHHSNLVPWQLAAQETGAKLCYLYPDRETGVLSEKEIRSKIGPKTKITAIAQVSNVLGILTPVEKIIKISHSFGSAVILDCAQSAPHIRLDMKALDVDFAAFSGHKLYAPMGVGVLYGKKELLNRMKPFLSGGDMIASVHEQTASFADTPRRFEAGTRNVGGEVGLAAAIRYMESIGMEQIIAHERMLTEYAIASLEKLPYVKVYGGKTAENRYGVISFNVDGVHPHDTATILDMDGVCVRAGHHCAQPLMEYLGITACCRASFAVYTTKEDIDALCAGLQRVQKIMHAA